MSYNRNLRKFFFPLSVADVVIDLRKLNAIVDTKLIFI